MPVNSRTAIDPRWFNAVRSTSRGFETARIRIYDPNSRATTPYDHISGTGGTSAPITLWPTENQDRARAWVEVIRSSSGMNVQPQATDQVQVRVHIDLDTFGPTTTLKAGHQIRVLDGGRDHSLENKTLIIRKVSVGNLAVQRTLDCTIDEKALSSAS